MAYFKTNDGGYKKLSSYEYTAVGRDQVYLTEDEEIKLVTEYKTIRDILKRTVLNNPVCSSWFVNMFNETLQAGRSVARFSADFNPQKIGYSKTIEQNMIKKIQNAKGNIGKVLYSLNLTDYCYEEMIKLLNENPAMSALKTRIGEIENVLMRSMLMVAHEIANKNSYHVLSIDYNDAAQETLIYLLESIRRYDPDYRTPDGSRVKLCTFAYSRANKMLQEWVIANSRLIRVPRSKMERILIIIKAYDSLPTSDTNLVSITEMSNKILKERKGEFTKSSAFTVDEVDDLIKILTTGYVHLDMPTNKSFNNSSPATIGDMISNDDIPQDSLLEKENCKVKLMEILKENLTETEYQIITLRYFYDDNSKVPKALTEVKDMLSSVYQGKEYSRESIRKIEKVALLKLKDIREARRLWATL